MDQSQQEGFIPFGLQTGGSSPMESSFATSMIYNSHNHEITLTGGTYGNYFKPGAQNEGSTSDPDCFIGLLRLRDSNEESWVRRRQYGSPSVPEFCSDIRVRDGGRTIAIGHSGENGIFSHLRPFGTNRRTVYGMVLDLDDAIELDGGALLHSNEVQYPVAMDTSGEGIYIASIFTDAKPDSSQFVDHNDDLLGVDFSSTGYYNPRKGLDFAIRIQKLVDKKNSNVASTTRNGGIGDTFHQEWSREYGARGMENTQASTVDYISPSALMLTGCTRGSGDAFGEPKDSSIGTLDSFVMLLDPATGNMVLSKRIESDLPGDDKILGTCQGNANEIYVVGMTTGVFDATYMEQGEPTFSEHSTYAFVLKLDLRNLEVIWSRQIGSSGNVDSGSNIHGVGCVVTPDGEEVYMAGNVKDGTSISLPDHLPLDSAGHDDIFVSKFDAMDGKLRYALQIGSPGNDMLAPGKSLATDNEGNLILLGNTDGAMYRKKATTGATDIFLLSVGRIKGDFLAPFGTARASSGSMGISHDDPVKQAQHKNATVSVLTLLCLLCLAAVVVFWVAADVVKRRRAKGNREAVEKAIDTDAYKFGSDDSILVDTYGWGQDDKIELRSAIQVLPSRKDVCPGSSDDEYLGSKEADRMENCGSVLSTVGKANHNLVSLPTEKLMKTILTQTKRQESPRSIKEEQDQEKSESSAYEEINELLSQASDRLDLGSVTDSDMERRSHVRMQKKVKQANEMTLDDVWNMDFV